MLYSNYMPCQTVPWQRALTWVVTGHAQVLEEYDDWEVHSAFQTFTVPSVIRLVKTVAGYFKRGVKFNRKNVWTRDKGTCQYCGTAVSQSEFTFEHVIPRKLGGQTTWENIVVACHPCNQKKKDRTPAQAGMKLLSKPVRPRALASAPVRTLTVTRDTPACWKDYLGSFLYWNEPINNEKI